MRETEGEFKRTLFRYSLADPVPTAYVLLVTSSAYAVSPSIGSRFVHSIPERLEQAGM